MKNKKEIMTYLIQLFQNVANDMEITYTTFQNLILISYLCGLSYMFCSWLAEKGFLPKRMANALRFIALIVSVPITIMMIFNHILTYVIPFYDAPIHIFVGALFAAPSGIVFINNQTRGSSGSTVLGATVLTLPMFLVLLWLGPDALIFKAPSILAVLMTYTIAISIVNKLDMYYYKLCADFSVYLCLRSKSYESLLKNLKNHNDKSHALLTITCALNLSLLNFLKLYQHCTCGNDYVILALIAFSIALNASLGIGLMDSNDKTKYHYNLAFQTLINTMSSIRRVWFSLRNDQLPRVSMMGFGMVLFCALANTSSAFAMEHVLETQISSETMGMGDSSQSTPRHESGQPIGEGSSVSKTAKIAVDGAKMASEKLKPHADMGDMPKRISEASKNRAAESIVTGATLGITGFLASVHAYFGNWSGYSISNPGEQAEQLTNTDNIPYDPTGIVEGVKQLQADHAALQKQYTETVAAKAVQEAALAESASQLNSRDAIIADLQKALAAKNVNR